MASSGDRDWICQSMLMKHLTDQLHSLRSALRHIELAVMAHKRLVDIHSFVDALLYGIELLTIRIIRIII